jgi:hypothetical protein
MAKSVLLKSSVVVRFLWEKEHNAKDIHEEIFPAYGGKCKAVHIWMAKFPLMTTRFKRRYGSG